VSGMSPGSLVNNIVSQDMPAAQGVSVRSV
jgi:hypothetical protein